jgi:polysaccharide biosynthesis PFTS motif protein
MHASNLIKWQIFVFRLLFPSRLQRAYLARSYQKLLISDPNFEKLRLVIGDIATVESNIKYNTNLLISYVSYNEAVTAMNQQIIHFIFSKFWYRKTVLICSDLGLPLFLPIKKEWARCYANRGIRVNAYVCSIGWYLFLFLYQTRSFLKFFKFYLTQWSMNDFNTEQKDTTRKYFYDFPDKALISSSQRVASNFLQWYIDETDQESKIFCSNNIFTKNVCGRVNIFGKKVLKLEVRLLSMLIIKLLNYLIHRNFQFFFILLINIYEISNSIRVELYQKRIPYDVVVFNASLGYARPLWSVTMTKFNIKSHLYFYANNSSPLSGDFNNSFLDGWQLNNWDTIYALDQHQANSIKSLSGNKFNIEVTNTVPMWTDEDLEIDNLPNNYVLIFDNNLHLYNYNFGFLAANGADSFSKIESFLKDISIIANHLQVPVVYKRKRPSSSVKDKEMEVLLAGFESENSDLVKILSDDISPHRLIKEAKFVVGRPFSTALLIANESKIGCAYYDVTGSVKEGDPESRGIKLIYNQKELEELINEYL